jgi:HD-GYP domain-containing protein (c-di-GMP phosphodiesterase class II)
LNDRRVRKVREVQVGKETGNGNGGPLPGGVTVVIQDPHSLVRDCLRVVVEQLDGAQVIAEVATPRDALEAALHLRPDIVFLDLADKSSAIPVVEALSKEIDGSRVICLADDVTDGVIEDAVKAGATAFALKSDSVDDLIRALNQVRLGRATIAPNAAEPLLHHYMQVIQEKHRRDVAVINALASAIEAKDSYSGGHTQRVTRLASKIAKAHDSVLGSSEQLSFGFTLHDVGKIGVPEDILLKPAALTGSEWDVMRTHPLIGMQIIRPVGFGDLAEGVVLHHHERWDGHGYPDGLAAEDIPLGARLFAVADAFDAMTSDRPYRRALPRDEAIREIVGESGEQFDPSAVKTFISVLG